MLPSSILKAQPSPQPQQNQNQPIAAAKMNGLVKSTNLNYTPSQARELSKMS